MLIETKRITLTELSERDTAFILRLVNEPSFLENIGDKGVRNEDDALKYLEDGPFASYAEHGFGLWRVGLKSSDVAIGISGLIKRDTLDHVDIGFAFLPEYWRQGFASEAGAAVLDAGRQQFGLATVVAITHPKNNGSIAVLERLGLTYQGLIHLGEGANTTKLFRVDF